MKVVSLVSGGIDSAVATALAMEQNAEIVAVHALLYPFSSTDTTEKVKKILQKLANRFNRKIKLIVVPFSEVHEEIAKNTKRKYACVLCKRMMRRAAEKIALQENADALLTGESLGQVASQTLPNLETISTSVSLPVLKPLLGMDKMEIEKLAKKFQTYEISILPGSTCRLVPEKPSTQAKLKVIDEEEKKLDIEKMISEALEGKKVHEITSKH